MKPIPDKAEIVLEFPDKYYSGTFERSSRFDAHFDASGMALTLSHGGSKEERRAVRMHLRHGLFADVLRELAKTAAALGSDEATHREGLAQAASALADALRPPAQAVAPPADDDLGDLTADEEVKLLHILE